MSERDLTTISLQDLTRGPVEVAERVWWVGHVQENDQFQCHVYLLEQGDQSILFDPGSRLTFEHTLRKIEQVTAFSNIRYFVCHHQDPDIAGALPAVDALVDRPDAAVITHGRAYELLKHYALKMPFWLVDDHDWQLALEDRLLRFVFTPYAHFPGAFCTFDTRSRALFSSDLFGGFTEEFSLVARDEAHFEALRPFHEHYIPSREILGYALAQLERHPVRIILPQHGSIIPEHLVAFMFAKLKELECGLYLMTGKNSDVRRLSRLNQAQRDITQTMVRCRDLGEIAKRLLGIAQRVLPAQAIEFFSRTEEGTVLHFAPDNRYRGAVGAAPAPVGALMGIDRKAWDRIESGDFQQLALACEKGADAQPCILLPLFTADADRVQSVAVIRLSAAIPAGGDEAQMIEQMEIALQVAVERETIYRSLDLERERIYERSIRDPLTGLFTRRYMQDTVQRLFAIHDRDASAVVALAMLDIDHFKRINDTYGHIQGDLVLERVAATLQSNVRAGDLPVRLGGEEFGLFMVGDAARHIEPFAQRLRAHVEALVFAEPLDGLRVTVSIGIAVRREGEDLTQFMERADRALYEAKNNGRNQVRMIAA